jgi:hypothetical protein
VLSRYERKKLNNPEIDRNEELHDMTKSHRRSAGREEHAKVVDIANGMDVIDGDLSLFKEIVDLFPTVQKSFDEIQKGITVGDPRAVEQAAQSVKAFICAFSRRVAHHAVLGLKLTAEESNLDQALIALRELRSELKLLQKALGETVGES